MSRKGEIKIVDYSLVKNLSMQACAFTGAFSCPVFIVSVLTMC